jgi:tyrosinase
MLSLHAVHMDELEKSETFTFDHLRLLKCTVQIGHKCGVVSRVRAAERFLNKLVATANSPSPLLHRELANPTTATHVWTFEDTTLLYPPCFSELALRQALRSKGNAKSSCPRLLTFQSLLRTSLVKLVVSEGLTRSSNIMRSSHVALIALVSSCAVFGAPTNDEAAVADLSKQAYNNIQKELASKQERSLHNDHCSLRTLRFRREWGSLSEKQRKRYIKAVQCLQEKPARTPSTKASGAKTRFDDFVATHINQTMTIHYTANFLSWHRYYTWLYEEALRQECGFEGDQPYWDWAKTAHNGLLSSPIFDGSDTSMSGNGADVHTANQTQIILGGSSGSSSGLPPVYLPVGSGGGCVQSGPFANMSVNLGPAALDIPGGVVDGPPSGNPLDYNPRCLKRDLTEEINQQYANASAVVSLILGSGDIDTFQMTMQGVPGTGNVST